MKGNFRTSLIMLLVLAGYALVGFLTANISHNSYVTLWTGFGILAVMVVVAYFTSNTALGTSVNTTGQFLILVVALTLAYTKVAPKYSLAVLGTAAIVYLISLILTSRRNEDASDTKENKQE